MTAAPELLTIRDLAISFGGLKAVDGIDVTVEQGEVHALIGPNGAGKTTVLNCVSRFYDAARGSIRFGGQELLGLKPHRVARLGIARTFQNLELFPELSVLDNVLIGRDRAMSAGILPAMLRLPSERREARRERDHALGLIDEVGLGGDADKNFKRLPFGITCSKKCLQCIVTDMSTLLDEGSRIDAKRFQFRVVQALGAVVRGRAGQFLGVAALADPAGAQRVQAGADVDARVRVGVRTGGVVDPDRRVRLGAEGRGRARAGRSSVI